MNGLSLRYDFFVRTYFYIAKRKEKDNWSPSHINIHITHHYRICQNILHYNRYAMWTLLVVKRMTCYNRCVSKKHNCSSSLLLFLLLLLIFFFSYKEREREEKKQERDCFWLVNKKALMPKFLSCYFFFSLVVYVIGLVECEQA
jgi:hypothetical protein